MATPARGCCWTWASSWSSQLPNSMQLDRGAVGLPSGCTQLRSSIPTIYTRNTLHYKHAAALQPALQAAAAGATAAAAAAARGRRPAAPAPPPTVRAVQAAARGWRQQAGVRAQLQGRARRGGCMCGRRLHARTGACMGLLACSVCLLPPHACA